MNSNVITDRIISLFLKVKDSVTYSVLIVSMHVEIIRDVKYKQTSLVSNSEK